MGEEFNDDVMKGRILHEQQHLPYLPLAEKGASPSKEPPEGGMKDEQGKEIF